MIARPAILRLGLLVGLAGALTLTSGPFPSPSAHGAPSSEADWTTATKKKKKKKKRKARRSRRRRARRNASRPRNPVVRTRTPKKRRITARTIKRWQNKGWTDARIVARAEKAGYRATKREQARLRKARVRRSLRTALVRRTAEPRGAARFNLHQSIDPNDIDFDSVPPPDGMPEELAKAHRRAVQRRTRAASRRSARSARAARLGEAKRRRTPIRKSPRRVTREVIGSVAASDREGG